MSGRSYENELEYLQKLTPYSWRIKKGFVPNMKVEGIFYVNSPLEELMFEEWKNFTKAGGIGGFLPGMKQIANVAALPGIVGVRILILFEKRFKKSINLFVFSNRGLSVYLTSTLATGSQSVTWLHSIWTIPKPSFHQAELDLISIAVFVY